MEVLHQLFSQDKHINTFIQQIGEKAYDSQLITGLTGSARPVLISTIFKQFKKSLYVLSPNLLQAQKLVDDLSALVGEEVVHYYPAEEFIAADMTIASPELRASRIATLNNLTKKNLGFLLFQSQVCVK